MSQPAAGGTPGPAPQRDRTGRVVLGVVAVCLGVLLLLCGLGSVLYGFTGYVMVHEGQNDPWVRGSLIAGSVAVCLGLPAAVAGIWTLWRA